MKRRMKRKRIYLFIGLALIMAVVVILINMLAGKKEKKENETKYNNIFVIYCDKNRLYGYYEGEYVEFEISKTDKSYASVVADITCIEDRVIKMAVKGEYISGKLLAIGEDYVEVDRYGKVPLEDKVKLYSEYDNIKSIDKKDIYIGYDCYKYFVADGKVAAIVITKKLVPDTIRVLIKTGNYESTFHQSLTVTCEDKFFVSVNDLIREYKAGEKIVIDCKDYKDTDKIVIKGYNDAPISLPDVKRNSDGIRYEGILEVSRHNEGLVVVNELPLENYLKYVVPSEMPYTYAKEALKAQAICARTYAYAHILNAGLKEYGAHLDDSVSYQVYNNVKDNEATNEAILETFGMILKNGEALANINYYSTSCGYGADESVWGVAASDADTLTAHSINDEKKQVNMSENSAFEAFITCENESDYDYSYSYYRWSGTIDLSELAKKLNIGDVTSVQVSKRLESGCATELTVIGTKGKEIVSSQYSIRTLLGGNISQIITKNQSTSSTSILPSAFFVLKDSGETGKLTIIGGGLGHGAGMSQNGANEMAKRKKKYDEILYFFFDNSNIMGIY